MEALSRFAHEPHRPPDVWFAEAAAVGLGTQLELAAVRAAVAGLDQLPRDTYLAAERVARRRPVPATCRYPPPRSARLVLELTEHTGIATTATGRGPRTAARVGVRLSVDDAGAGFASLRHILNLNPDIIKLDIGLIQGIDADPARRALASALVSFAGEIDAVIVAEGIETESELATLSALGVTYGQGFHLARPGQLPLPERLPFAKAATGEAGGAPARS